VQQSERIVTRYSLARSSLIASFIHRDVSRDTALLALLKEESPVVYPVRAIALRFRFRSLRILLMNLPARGNSSNNGGVSLEARPGHPDASLTQLNDGA